MKKFSYFFGAFVIATFSLFLASCENDSISYSVNAAGGTMKFYSSYENFLVGKDTANFKTVYSGTHIATGDHIPAGFPVSFVDFRQEDGRSNWTNPGISAYYPYIYDDSGSSGGWYFYINYFDRREFYRIAANSPPAHLHLCLRTLDEDPKGKRPGRTWKVKSIVDEKGNDLTKDPDWENYTDNTMRFEKTNRFVFTVGEKRSAKEIEIFGEYPKNNLVYGTYNFGTLDYYQQSTSYSNTLYLVFPDFKRQLEVVESTFGMVKLKGTEGGKTGILVLEPID